ncbi:mlr9161 (plasmid) [Mesorhizobium japonicum MAFF 303099]|uniref:Mlr9161 protein n=1 Tax=Mesorhizobium japonicum (strain LMG 29417 / CECT 9101 / MAFF 303099) TaxID=266835 RepID=Q982A4_RHILO|nr:mlr9161 [Mesorhizobium japonicum MAFF 303099]
MRSAYDERVKAQQEGSTMKPQSVSLAPPLGFLYRIGQCQKCMRQSFVAAMALVSGAIVITAGFERSFPALTLAVVSLASAATALWIIHIVVFGLRAATYARSPRQDEDGLDKPRTFSRRALIGLFLKTVAGATLATALPGLAAAMGECPGKMNCGFSSCAQSGQVWCCPRGYPILNLCNCSCYQTVQGVTQAGCNQTGSCFTEF